MRADLYNVIIQTGNLKKGKEGFLTWHNVNHKKVQNDYLIKRDIKSCYPDWRFATIYNAKTGLKELMIQPD